MNPFKLTDSLRDASQGRGRVGCAGDVSPDVVRLNGVLAHAHVLADVGDLSALAAGNVILAVCREKTITMDKVKTKKCFFSFNLKFIFLS